jgi:hypothetical protein
MSYTGDLYDTASGLLDPGYVLASTTPSATTTAGTVAHVIGTQSWTVCHDADNHTFEFKLTPDEYSALAQPGAGMPQESVMEPAGQN